jgi:hypothetical protein
MTTWSFQSKGHSRWLEAECERCRVKSHMQGVRGFKHCGRIDPPPKDVVKQWEQWTPAT